MSSLKKSFSGPLIPAGTHSPVTHSPLAIVLLAGTKQELHVARIGWHLPRPTDAATMPHPGSCSLQPFLESEKRRVSGQFFHSFALRS